MIWALPLRRTNISKRKGRALVARSFCFIQKHVEKQKGARPDRFLWIKQEVFVIFLVKFILFNAGKNPCNNFISHRI